MIFAANIVTVAVAYAVVVVVYVANVAIVVGMWYPILEFINLAAVITNAFLITFVSDWGLDNFTTGYDKLAAVLVIEVISNLL